MLSQTTMKDMETISLIKNDKQTIKNNDYHVSCYPIWRIVMSSLGLAILLLLIVSCLEKKYLINNSNMTMYNMTMYNYSKHN